jgi:hypothetical protein
MPTNWPMTHRPEKGYCLPKAIPKKRETTSLRSTQTQLWYPATKDMATSRMPIGCTACSQTENVPMSESAESNRANFARMALLLFATPLSLLVLAQAVAIAKK